MLETQAACQKRINECARCIRELYLDKVKGIISEPDFADMRHGFSAEKGRLENQIAAINAQLEELEARIAAGDNRRMMIEQYTNLEHLNREMVEILIDYIVVGKRIPGKKNPPIEIHWNF